MIFVTFHNENELPVYSNVTQVASAEVTIDSAASNVKYTKISVKIDPQTSGSDATQTLDGAEITLYAAQ